jgi:hypothetical protein
LHQEVTVRRVSICSLALVCVLAASRSLSAQAPAAEDAALKATANPELVGAVAKELGSTPKQAEGATGALFALAKTRLKPEEFTKVSGSVPGMSGLLKAAPALEGGSALSKVAGTTGSSSGLAAVAGSFSKLGLSPDVAMKAVPVLTNYVTKSGGADVGKLLAGALK